MAIKKDPHRSGNYSNKGITLLKLSQFDQAFQKLNIAIKMNSKVSGYYINKGVALEKLGLTDDALIQFDHAIKLNPDQNIGFNNIAMLLIQNFHDNVLVAKQLKNQESLNYLNKAIQLHLENDIHYQNQGIILFILDINFKFIKFRIILRGHVYIFLKFLIVILYLKYHEEASNFLDSAINNNSQCYQYYQTKSTILLFQKRISESLQYSRLAYQRNPDDFYRLLRACLIYNDVKQQFQFYFDSDFIFELKQYQEALEKYKLVILKSPDLYYPSLGIGKQLHYSRFNFYNIFSNKFLYQK